MSPLEQFHACGGRLDSASFSGYFSSFQDHARLTRFSVATNSFAQIVVRQVRRQSSPNCLHEPAASVAFVTASIGLLRSAQHQPALGKLFRDADPRLAQSRAFFNALSRDVLRPPDR